MFKCKICNKEYPKESSLKRHMTAHLRHGEKETNDGDTQMQKAIAHLESMINDLKMENVLLKQQGSAPPIIETVQASMLKSRDAVANYEKITFKSTVAETLVVNGYRCEIKVGKNTVPIPIHEEYKNRRAMEQIAKEQQAWFAKLKDNPQSPEVVQAWNTNN
jgi:hypothetical protein